MNKILILIGSILLLGGFYSCSDDDLSKESIMLPPDPDANIDNKIPNDMWGWVVSFPGEVNVIRERFDDVNVVVKGYAVQPSFNVKSRPKYWQTTGLYVAPTEKVEVVVPDGVAGKLFYHIGVADISLGDISTGLKRFGNVTKKGELKSGLNVIDNNFGGHLYFYYSEVPSPTDVTLVVSGAVKSIDFVNGTTDLQAWSDAVKDTIDPMIWGELIGNNIAITLPIKTLSEIPNPGAVIEVYDQLIEDLLQLWSGISFSDIGVPLWRLYADKQLPANVNAFPGYPAGIDMGNDAIMNAFKGMHGNSGVLADRKFIYNALGSSFLTSWYNGALLTSIVPQLSSYYISNKASMWPHGYVVSSLTTVKPDVKNYGDLSEEFKLRMLIQLVQEYGWGLFTYVNKSLGEEFSTLSEEQFLAIPLQILNDCFAIAASEYANVNLTPFFEAWGFTLTGFSKNYIAQYPVVNSNLWSEFNTDMPSLDLKLTPKPLGRPKPSLVVDSTYAALTWTASASSSTPLQPVTQLIDELGGNTNWHNNWTDANHKSYPHEVWFNFDDKVPTEHELEFNYVMIMQFTGHDDKYATPKEFRVAVFEAGDWVLVDEGRVFSLHAGDGKQFFYLNKNYTSTAVKIILLNNHSHEDGSFEDADGNSVALVGDCTFGHVGIGLMDIIE